jgi:hypothetical protein
MCGVLGSAQDHSLAALLSGFSPSRISDTRRNRFLDPSSNGWDSSMNRLRMFEIFRAYPDLKSQVSK